MKLRLALFLTLSLLMCMIFGGCSTLYKCPTRSDFLQEIATYDRAMPDDIMRVRVFSFPLPNDVMGSQDELQPYGELVEKWINETDECGTVIAIGLAIAGIEPDEDFRRLVFSVFYKP